MEVCTNPDILKIIQFVSKLLDIAFTVIPIGLILIIAIDFFKNIIASKEDEMKKNLSIVIKRIIYCVVIFLVPTIVNLVNTIINELLEDTKINYTECFTHANSEYIEERILHLANEALNKAEAEFSLDAAIEAENLIYKIKDKTTKENLLGRVEQLKNEIRATLNSQLPEPEDDILTNEGSNSNGQEDNSTEQDNDSTVQGDGNSKGTLTSPIDPKDTNQKMLERMRSNSKTLYYLSGEYHGGSDVPVPIGTTIYAMDGGKVYSAKQENSTTGYGNYIILEHDKGYYSVYAHLSAVNVKKGDKVSQGQQIGKSGNTGNSTGPHLHIELTTSDEVFGKSGNCVHILTLDYIGTGKKYTSAKGYCKP